MNYITGPSVNVCIALSGTFFLFGPFKSVTHPVSPCVIITNSDLQPATLTCFLQPANYPLHHYWPAKIAIVILPIRLKGNLKRISSNLLNLLEARNKTVQV